MRYTKVGTLLIVDRERDNTFNKSTLTLGLEIQSLISRVLMDIDNAIKTYHTEGELYVSNKSMYRLFFEGVWAPMKQKIKLT